MSETALPAPASAPHEHADGALLPGLGLLDLLRESWKLAAVAVGAALAAWALTLQTASDFQQLMMAQLAAPSPPEVAAFVGLSAVMMTAMMLPSAVPMLAAFARVDREGSPSPRQSSLHTALFSAGYIALWGAMTATSLVALGAAGLVGAMGGAAASAPGVLLIAAGVWQFTGWKKFCLTHCKTPTAFLLAHYRAGAGGALRTGFHHALFCLGCCWLLMLVWFVAAAMSALWMAVFGAFILAEKTVRSSWVSYGMGAACVVAGAAALHASFTAPLM